MFDNEKLQGIRGGQTQNGTTPKNVNSTIFWASHPLLSSDGGPIGSPFELSLTPAYDFSIMAKKCRAKVLRQQGISHDDDPLIPKQ